MRQVFNFFTGVIMGGLVGATIAILLAPVSGEEFTVSDPGTIHPIEG